MTVTEAPATMPRLKARYQNEIKAQLQQDLGIKNVMQVPTLEKIVINMGVGRAAAQPSLIEGCRLRPHRDRRTEAGRHQGQELDRQLQVA